MPFLGLHFDQIDARTALMHIATRTDDAPFAYVVTPNVQHVVMADRDPGLIGDFDAAWLSLCDSRPVRLLGRLSGIDLPLVTGSDLTVALFAETVQPGDKIAVICPSDHVARALRDSRPDLDWEIHLPPAGTEPGTSAFVECVDFIAETGARLTFVCLGAPKSEAMCHAALDREGATGTALCTGASLEFMLGLKARAPKIVQRAGLEWLYRMVTEPKRLAGRYLSAFLPLLRIWLRGSRS